MDQKTMKKIKEEYRRFIKKLRAGSSQDDVQFLPRSETKKIQEEVESVENVEVGVLTQDETKKVFNKWTEVTKCK